MARQIDLSKLFDRERHPPTFKDLDEQLAAIASGQKVISVFAFSSSDMESDDLYCKLARRARDLALLVVHVPWTREIGTRSIRQTEVFVLKSDTHLWRIPAIRMLQQIGFESSWSEALEVLQSRLLGYTEVQIEDWIKIRRDTQVGEDITVFVVLSSSQKRVIVESGGRHFPDGIDLKEVQFIFSRSRLRLRRDVDISKLIAGKEIARVSVSMDFFMSLFEKPLQRSDKEIVVAKLADPRSAVANVGLRSRIEFRQGTNWI